MALMVYADVRPWAVAIREEVLERRMPPWNAVKGFGDFRDDGGLSQDEMLRIAEWVTGGAPEGDPAHLSPFHPVHATPVLPAYETTTAGNGTVLSSPLDLMAIRPFEVPDGASIKVTAHSVDGRIEPLLWILDYRSKWNRTYRYLDPIKLQKGTRIQISPAVATFRLVAPSAKPRR